MAKCQCQKQDKVNVNPKECSEEQIKACHGHVEGHCCEKE